MPDATTCVCQIKTVYQRLSPNSGIQVLMCGDVANDSSGRRLVPVSLRTPGVVASPGLELEPPVDSWARGEKLTSQVLVACLSGVLGLLAWGALDPAAVRVLVVDEADNRGRPDFGVLRRLLDAEKVLTALAMAQPELGCGVFMGQVVLMSATAPSDLPSMCARLVRPDRCLTLWPRWLHQAAVPEVEGGGASAGVPAGTAAAGTAVADTAASDTAATDTVATGTAAGVVDVSAGTAAVAPADATADTAATDTVAADTAATGAAAGVVDAAAAAGTVAVAPAAAAADTAVGVVDAARATVASGAIALDAVCGPRVCYDSLVEPVSLYPSRSAWQNIAGSMPSSLAHYIVPRGLDKVHTLALVLQGLAWRLPFHPQVLVFCNCRRQAVRVASLMAPLGVPVEVFLTDRDAVAVWDRLLAGDPWCVHECVCA